MRYRTWVVFRFGSYCLPYSRRISNLRYSFPGKTRSTFPYRAVTFYGAPFQGTSGNIPVVRLGHISSALLHRIQIDLYRFRSTLLAASIVLSFPAGTEMIHFPAFPLPNGSAFRPVIRFRNPRITGCMRLPVDYRSLPRPSSAPKPIHPLHGVVVHLMQNT